MDQQRDAGPPDVVLNEANVLTAQPGREQVLDGQTRRPKLVWGEHETKRKHYISQSKCYIGSFHCKCAFRKLHVSFYAINFVLAEQKRKRPFKRHRPGAADQRDFR